MRCGAHAAIVRRGPAVLAAILLAACAAASLHAGQQPAVPATVPDLPAVSFRTEVTFIEVDVFVTDSAGRSVTDLTVDDFELFEDGVRQQVQSFSAVNLPIERLERPLYASRPIQPDVRTNVGTDGRIYLILLDDIHVHPTRAPRAKAALHQFLDRNFGTNDVAAVLHVRGGSGDSQDFTNDPDLLRRAIDRFTGNIPREAASELEVAYDARNVASRIRELSEFLAGVRGRRKTMLFVSEGSPFDVHAVTGQLGAVASIVTEDTRKAIDAAARGNVTIYTVDPRGLMPSDPNTLSAEAPSSGNPVRLSQDNLRELAYETGGFPAVNQNDLEGAFERIVRENSVYYLLGYTPANDVADGSYRRLQVRLARPGLQVRSRNGYTAARASRGDGESASRSSAAAMALSSPFPSGEIPLALFAAPFRGSGRTALVTVAVELDATALVFLERDGTFHERVEVLHSVTDSRGNVHAPLRHELNLALRPETHDRIQTHGLRVLLQTELPAGRYQVRVAAGSLTSGQAGGVLQDLEVPDFTRRGLTMSGLVIASSRETGPVTVAAAALASHVPAQVTTSRQFSATDTLTVLGEVYENVRNAPVHAVDITTELRTDTGMVVRSSVDSRSSSELQGSDGGYGFSTDLPLSGLQPGLYVIHVEARSSLAREPVVGRDVLIRVH